MVTTPETVSRPTQLRWRAVLVLLPPSEGKTAPASGAPLDLGALSFAELTAARERLLKQVIRLSEGSPRRALDALGLSPRREPELAFNRALRTAWP